jgi:hypothetical protein
LVNGAFDEVTYNTSAPTITNLLQYTEQFDVNTFWIKTRSNIGATNAVVAPDGTLTADKLIEDTTATQSHYINGPSSAAYVTSSSLPVGSIYVKAGERTSCGLAIIRDAGTAFASGTFNVDLSTGTVLSGTGNIASAGNGWYRISTPATTFGANYALRLLLNQSGTTSTYTGDGTSGLYIWGAQLEPGTVATTYQGKGASTILTPTWATKTAPDTVYASGVFDEVTYNSATPTIKNLLSYSQDFTNSVWTNYQQYANSIVITGNITTAPDGTLTASKLASNNASATYYSFFRYGASGTTANTYHIYSTYFKAAEETHAYITFYSGYNNSWMWDLSTQTLSVNSAPDSNLTITSTPSLTSVGNGWYRAAIPFRYGNTIPASWAYKYGLDGGSRPVGNGFYLWGAQLETGNVATTYQGVTASNTLVAPNFARRETQSGDMYVTNSYDEFTGAPVVDSSLLWWFDAVQTTSYSGTGTTVRNLSNTAQNGTISGNVTYSTTNGGQFVFSDYLDTTNTISAGNIGYPASVNDPWTMEAWIYVPTGATWSINNNVGPLYIRGSYSGAHGLVRMQADNTVAVWLRGNTTALAYRTGVTIRNQWNHVAGVWTGGAGGNLQCYINGTLTQSGTTTQDDPLKNNNFYAIGAANTGMSNNTGAVFVGSISSTKLYTRALSADEVAQNFNALRRRYNI